MLGGAERIAGGRVHDHDPLPCRRRLVDVVGADASSDDRPQTTISLQRFGSDLHTTAADRPIKLRQGFAQQLSFQAGANLILNTRFRVEKIQTFLSDVVKNDDAMHSFLSTSFAWLLLVVDV